MEAVALIKAGEELQAGMKELSSLIKDSVKLVQSKLESKAKEAEECSLDFESPDAIEEYGFIDGYLTAKLAEVSDIERNAVMEHLHRLRMSIDWLVVPSGSDDASDEEK